MIVTTTKAQLEPAVRRCAQALRAGTMPVLDCLRIEAVDGALDLEATNLDEWRRARLAATIDGAGGGLIDGRRLAAIAAALPDKAEVRLVIDAGSATISAGRARWQLATLPLDDWPQVRAPDAGGVGLTLDGATLAAGLRHSQLAAGAEETRYYLNGTHVCRRGEQLLLTATDGKRLARTAIALPPGAPDLPEAGWIVPTALAEAAIALAEAGGAVALACDGERLRIEAGAWQLTGRLVDGTYPDADRVIPDADGARLTVKAAELLAAARRVVALAEVDRRKGERPLRALRLEVAGAELVLSSRDRDVQGEASDRVACQADGFDFVTGFNADYLVAAAGWIGEGELVLTQRDAGSPALFRAAGDDVRLHVVMPLRV